MARVPGSDTSNDLTLVPTPIRHSKPPSPPPGQHGTAPARAPSASSSAVDPALTEVPELIGAIRQASPLRAAILSFSSIWFLIPQGTGITSTVLFRLDYQFRGLDIISYIVWGFTAVSLLLMLVLYATRTALDPRHVVASLGHNAGEVACFSSVSIAFTSCVQMVALALGHIPGWATAACILWWVNMGLALVACTIIPYYYLHVQPPGAQQILPVTQLPLVAAITLAAGGGVVVAGGFATGTEAPAPLRLPIAMVSYLFLGLGMPLALAMSTVYLVRLFDGVPPPGGKVYQDMILAGPWGQGSFALQALGGVLASQAEAFAAYSPGGVFFSRHAVEVVGYASMFLGFLSWGQGTFWWFYASTSVGHSHVSPRKRTHDHHISYSLAEWSLVFPWVSLFYVLLILFSASH
ncbi:uncharacterized protein E0L32_006492 [Thyridium curvatum]|uniref:Uncharacterized protein n=1 Tax=Thyridium curvatum TaxID=1093900 RepID=A0A507B1X7_9PEZI|nr:uncharacterized protein E0L32_006492 [Thyridium curvatum]TPX13066.1 hypothetical protein E0L32_006492 [Thyridium curvatum]